MGEFIDKNALIGDDYRAVILCEYTHDLSLIKQLIEIAEKAISLKSRVIHGLVMGCVICLQNQLFHMQKWHTII